ncbi:hypothetical protein [Nocardioides flavescens]|uniref:Uncharacterized protein n=1 Tax=Nocardioides flavescens TaxID=2691959 RepID=A0A6L7F489_9ACTN|nr:hypothetical protein [Nocardioides flavescens]MXG92057.1 hypothetical protein [Nocardioides flavescens]
MAEPNLADLYEHVGRVVVPAAQFEIALATIAYAALGGDEDATSKTHALQTSQLKTIIESAAAAHPEEWWTQPALELLARSVDPLGARHRVVHGHWTDLRGVAEGRTFVTFKPDRRSGRWHGQFLDFAQLGELAEEFEHLAAEARELADRMVDAVHGH